VKGRIFLLVLQRVHVSPKRVERWID